MLLHRLHLLFLRIPINLHFRRINELRLQLVQNTNYSDFQSYNKFTCVSVIRQNNKRLSNDKIFETVSKVHVVMSVIFLNIYKERNYHIWSIIKTVSPSYYKNEVVFVWLSVSMAVCISVMHKLLNRFQWHFAQKLPIYLGVTKAYFPFDISRFQDRGPFKKL